MSPDSAEEKSAAFIHDPVLVVWSAMHLLAEAQKGSQTIEISEVLARTERILFKLLLELTWLTKNKIRNGIVIH